MKIAAEEIQSLFPSFEEGLVQEIVVEAELISLHPGQYLLRKGQYLRSMLLLVDGLVKVIRENGDNNEYFLHYLGKGDACALTMLGDSQRRMSQLTICAVSAGKVLAIPLTCMDKWMLSYRSWYHFVWASFAARLDALFETIDTIAFHPFDEQLVHYLKSQEARWPSKVLSVTRTEIAKELNTSREVVSRSLKKLSAHGKLKVRRRSIEIVSLD